MRLGIRFKELLSGLNVPNPPGMVWTLQSTRWIGYLAVACFNATACPREMDDATLTFRTYGIASAISSLKLIPAADKTRQNFLCKA